MNELICGISFGVSLCAVFVGIMYFTRVGIFGDLDKMEKEAVKRGYAVWALDKDGNEKFEWVESNQSMS